MHDIPWLADPDPVAALARALHPFLGVWRGFGAVAFPTIESAGYAEECTFSANQCEPILHFEQRTWKLDPNGAPGDPLHWESGFFRSMADGTIELTNAQNNGRLEILRGTLDVEEYREGRLVLSLSSTFHGNDPRMLSSARIYRLNGDRLAYEGHMATTRVAPMRRHLDATLHRVR